MSDISTGKSQHPAIEWKFELTMVYQKKLLLNPKSLLVDDFRKHTERERESVILKIYALYICCYMTTNKDGAKKLIVGYTDRFVRKYAWLPNNSTLASTTSSSSLGYETAGASSNASNTGGGGSVSSNNKMSGDIVLEQSWEFVDQV